MSIDASKGFLLPLLLSVFLVPAYGQTANSDAATIDQDTEASIDVTKNDFSLLGINKNTVDLNPNADKVQHTYTTDAGKFSSDSEGIVKFQPIAGFTGEAKASYTFRDNFGQTSNIATITITVRAVNHVPMITGQNPVVMQEGDSRELLVTDLIIDDPDPGDPYPSGFTLIVESGQSYTVSGTTITPAANFSGTLTVNVKVSDGDSESNSFGLKVTVNRVNSVPQITGQSSITIDEDQSRIIQLGDLIVSDADNTYPTGFKLTVLAGADYTFTTANSVTPAQNFNGTLTVNVQVNDGTDDSNVFGLQIAVNPVNDAPTLDAVTVTAIKEDAALQTVSLKGITAGPQETQDLTVTVTTNKPALFETLDIVYTSPQATGSLRIKPKTDANGTAQISITVQDNGPGTAPNVNSFKQIFNLTIQPVNDPPVFQSEPVLTASVNDPYVYNVVVTDPDGETLTLTAPTKPAWLTFAVQSNGKARLSGTTPANASGAMAVKISAKDASTTVVQSFTVTINSQPVVAPVTIQTQEDKMFSFSTQLFADAFTDADGDALAGIKITQLPRHGILKLNNASIQDVATIVIAAADIGSLTYTPTAEYSGNDTLRWNGSDGLSYGKTATYASISIANVNDPPTIEDLETDTLAYEVGNETPRLFTATFRAADADDDSLASAEVGFRRQNHNPLNDRLIFTNTKNIAGTFDTQAGILSLTGKAPLTEYTEAIRSIEYNYVNMAGMTLDIKTIYITLNDGKTFGETRNREIALIYTFKDLDIPTGFTPNGDNANDYWKISSAKGSDQYKDAEIRVFNRRGQLLYQSQGFENPWDGTYRGERLPVDTYYYTIDLKYNKVRYKGVVTILR